MIIASAAASAAGSFAAPSISPASARPGAAATPAFAPSITPAATAAAAHLDAPAPPALAEIVLCTAPAALTASRSAMRARLCARLAPLGLTIERGLGDRWPSDASARATPSNPFGLDPSRIWLARAPDTASATAALVAFAHDPGIEWAEPNRWREPASSDPFPDDPLFRDGRQWGLRNLGNTGPYGGTAGADIGAMAAWEVARGSNQVRLAIADTGIDPAHPDLAGLMPDGSPRITLGINVTSEAGGSFTDSLGHGTPVAGVMAARSGEGVHFDSLGVAGVCGGDGGENLGCAIVPIKIAPGHSRYATSFDIANAIVYATDHGARAMNLSFTGAYPSRLERLALYYAVTRGCVVVAAAGNRGYLDGAAPNYPAAYAADGLCIQVGASDPFDRRAVFSSYGPGLDVLAPGQDIWTTAMTYPSPGGIATNGYVAASGTSFAAPFVTGTVGLLCALRPELTDNDAQRVIRESAADLATPGVDATTGWGRLDAAAALEALAPPRGIWHDEVAATSFRPLATDTLVIGESGPGAMSAGSFPARLIEASVTVVLPDSFVGSVRVWPRVGGTMTVRPGFDLPYFVPWAEVAEHTPTTFTLRGYLYERPGLDAVPLPLDQARFGFTVVGAVEPRPRTSVPEPVTPIANRILATPHPFRERLELRGPPGAAIAIYDLSGRVVHRTRFDARLGLAVWNGRDRRGRRVPPGLYFLRAETAHQRLHGKALRLE